MSISQNFPEEGPTLNLNFAGSRTLDPRITFTRTSTGTYMGPDGLIKVASTNSPRFDHRYVNGEIESLGLLVEEQRTNNIQVSAPAPADIVNSGGAEGWVDRVNPIYNFEFSSVKSPDGTNNAVGVAYTSTYSNFQIPFNYNQQSLLTSDTAYTLSFWVDDTELVESGGYHLTTIIGTNIYSSITGRYFRVNYNKDTDTFLSPTYTTGSSVSAENADTIFPSANISGKVEKYPNNWKRISITFKVDSSYDGFYDSGNTLADARFSYGIYMGVSGYTNDNVGNSMSTWGWQLEQGSFPTSYIPTSGSTATRNPDNVSMVGDNFSDWYNQSEGTIYVSQKLKSIDTVDRNSLVYLINGGSGNDIFYNVKQGTTNIFVFGDNNTNYSRWQENGDSTDTKAIWAYDVSGDDFKPYWNGIEGVNESTTNTPSATSHTQLEIGATVGAKYNGHISQLTYYPTRLTNTQLQTLTR